MYPTPPSLETNKHSPPDTVTETPVEVTVSEGPVIKTESQPPVKMGTVPSEDISKVCFLEETGLCLRN